MADEGIAERYPEVSVLGKLLGAFAENFGRCAILSLTGQTIG